MTSAIGRSIADQIGLQDEVFVAMGHSSVRSVDIDIAAAPATATVATGPDADSKARDAPADAYVRTESSETQPVEREVGEGEGEDEGEANRVVTTPSAETEPDVRTEPDTDDPRNPAGPALDTVLSVDIIAAGSTQGTEVE